MASVTLPAAVLWDLDGTLVDTEPFWMAAETALVTAHGGVWRHEDGLGLIGNPLPQSARILQDAGVRLGVDEIIAELSERVIAAQAAGPRWQPGAAEIVRALSDAGVPQALVTSSYRNLTVPVVRAAGVFDVVVTGDEVSRPKPDPEPYLEAARRLGVDAAACVVVEDSPPGITSALAAGARVLAVEVLAQLPDDPRLSRTDSLTHVNVADLARIAAGDVLVLTGERA